MVSARVVLCNLQSARLSVNLNSVVNKDIPLSLLSYVILYDFRQVRLARPAPPRHRPTPSNLQFFEGTEKLPSILLCLYEASAQKSCQTLMTSGLAKPAFLDLKILEKHTKKSTILVPGDVSNQPRRWCTHPGPSFVYVWYSDHYYLCISLSIDAFNISMGKGS